MKMAEQQPDDFDESILNQPWDPVSYFEDEEESNARVGNDGLSESQGRKLSELFDDLNLKSLEHDLKRLSIRKQQSEEIPDSVFEKRSFAIDDAEEEPSSSIDRFITYEDKEDHLKAVDNTDVVNRKNIDSDMKRLAHFRKQSLDFQDQTESSTHENINDFSLSQIPEDSSRSQSYFDELVKVLPDVIQSDPSLPIECNSGKPNEFNESDFNISQFLPDPVTDDIEESKVENRNDGNILDGSGLDSGQLIEIGSDSKNAYTEIVDRVDMYTKNPVDSMDSGGSGHSRGSGDSLNYIIGQAEAIVKDYTEMFDSKVEHHDDGEVLQHTNMTNIHNLSSMSGRDDSTSSETVKHGYDMIQQVEPKDMAAGFDLLDDFGFENSKIDKMNTSVSSLHDELLSSSPTFDLCEPKFDVEPVTTSLLVDIEDGENSQVVENSSVKVKVSSDKKERKRIKKSNKPKYVVDIVKCEDSGSDDDIDNQSDYLSGGQQQHGTIDTKATLTAVDKLPILEANVNRKPTEIVAKEKDSNDSLQSNDGSETFQDGNKQLMSPEGDGGQSEEMILSEEAIQISEQLADEILNEDCNNIQIIQPTAGEHVLAEAAGAENQLDSDNSIVTSGIHDDNDGNTDVNTDVHCGLSAEVSSNADASMEICDVSDPVAVERTATRSGSTSDSEELEDFINQQLNDDTRGASAASPEPTGANPPLPPIDDEMQLGWYAPKWVPDKDARGCMNCGLKFTVVKRRHHCRACGKVLCSNCCNMKADLAYLSYKTSRVCQACFEILSKAQSLSPLPLMSGSQDVPGRGHTISLNDSEPGTSYLPLDSPPQYMPDSPPEYSVLPGGTVQNGPPNPPSYFASVRGSGFRSRTESDRSAVIMFNSSQTDLPPILRIENEVVKIINNPNLSSLFTQMKDKASEPVAFLVNKNLVVNLRIISLDCCIGKECWCFSSDGMGASNQEEIVFVVEYKGDDQRLLKCVFQQFNLIFERAKHGEPLSDFGYMPIDEYMQNNRKNVGMILFKPNVQCVKNLLVPCHPYLFGLWIHQPEVPWAKNLPLRLLIRLGAEFKCYPYPIYNAEDREPVFNVVGRTIIALLADFRSFQYTMPKISGLLVSVTKKDTTIKLPQTRYDEVLKVLNTSEESVMAFSGNFNSKADSHLVCVETDGTHATQTISCRSTNKKLTGCSFVVFSAALKSNTQNLQAKTSIVEDGIMVQVTSDTMKKIRTAMKEMQDLVTPTSESTDGSSEVHKLRIIWGSSDDSSSRISSPIDGSSFDGLTNMRIRHSYDFTVSTSPAKIHWQEVYFLPNDADTVGHLSAKDLSQMTSSVAKACMNALSPHLSTLVALEMTKIGLRMILDADMVEYRIGANREQLPQELTGDLDDKLIPVIHSVMKTVSHRRVSAELIFQITRIV